jgi:hypothetical protein
MGPQGFERPDKIVLYSPNPQEHRALLRRLRILLRGMSYHSISHTASPADMGLERRDLGGLYVGFEPFFLGRDVDWRMYSAVSRTWLRSNTRYLQSLPGGKELWAARMNLSLTHDGPASLEPPTKNIAYIRRSWLRMIQDLGDGATIRL